MTEHNSSNII